MVIILLLVPLPLCLNKVLGLGCQGFGICLGPRVWWFWPGVPGLQHMGFTRRDARRNTFDGKYPKWMNGPELN